MAKVSWPIGRLKERRSASAHCRDESQMKKENTLVGLEIEAGSVAAAEVRAQRQLRQLVADARSRPLPAGAFQRRRGRRPGGPRRGPARPLRGEQPLASGSGSASPTSGSSCEPCGCPRSTTPRSSTPRSASRPRSRSRCRSTRRCSTTGWSAASPATEDSAAADRRRRRRRPPRHDRRLARRRFATPASAGRRRPLRLRPDPRPRRPGGRRPAPRATGCRPPRRAVLYCNVGDVTNLAVAKGQSCLFTRVAPFGLEDWSATSPRPPA